MSARGEGAGRGSATSSAPTPGWLAAEREDRLRRVVLPGGVPMFFRRIEPGAFRMGSRDRSGAGELADAQEQPVHRVRITRPFYLGAFPVTQHQFVGWAAKHAPEHLNWFTGNDLLPAEGIRWSEAMAFCAWLTQDVLGETAERARLPTEAEWEYACRAGSDTEYASGDGDGCLRELGWFEANSVQRTHPVGDRRANAWGLYDMHGNVWEWCLDAWDGRVYRSRAPGVEDPVVAPEDVQDLSGSLARRVLRGGSWGVGAPDCRSAFRLGFDPWSRLGPLGFRVCLLPGPGPQAAGRGAPRADEAEAGAGDGERGGEPSRPAPGPPERAGGGRDESGSRMYRRAGCAGLERARIRARQEDRRRQARG